MTSWMFSSSCGVGMDILPEASFSVGWVGKLTATFVDRTYQYRMAFLCGTHAEIGPLLPLIVVPAYANPVAISPIVAGKFNDGFDRLSSLAVCSWESTTSLAAMLSSSWLRLRAPRRIDVTP